MNPQSIQRRKGDQVELSRIKGTKGHKVGGGGLVPLVPLIQGAARSSGMRTSHSGNCRGSSCRVSLKGNSNLGPALVAGLRQGGYVIDSLAGIEGMNFWRWSESRNVMPSALAPKFRQSSCNQFLKDDQ